MSFYTDHINTTLHPKITEPEKVIDLFAGCGGLSLGFEAAGFETVGYEMVPAAAETYNHNLKGICHQTRLDVGFDYPDRPARTITCRNLAGATSDMQRVKLPDGRRRRIVQREAARLQSFPDWFEFCGNEVQQFTQIGNAVPPLLAYRLALAVKDTIALADNGPESRERIRILKQYSLFDNVSV